MAIHIDNWVYEKYKRQLLHRQVNDYFSYVTQLSSSTPNLVDYSIKSFKSLAKKSILQMASPLKCSLAIQQPLWAVSILIHSASWPYQGLVTRQAGSVCVWQVVSRSGRLLMNWTQLKSFCAIPPHYHSANGINRSACHIQSCSLLLGIA